MKSTQAIQNPSEPIAKRTRSRTLTQKYTTPSHSRALAEQLLTHVANSVLEQETEKQLNYGKLRKHPRFQETWNRLFSNKMGRVCQGVGTGTNGIGEIVEVTNTFFIIKFEDIQKIGSTKSATLQWFLKCDQARSIQTEQESQYVIQMSATQEMSAQIQPHLNSSNVLSTVYYQEQELSMCASILKKIT